MDFAISRDVQGISNVKILNEPASDHFPISFSINGNFPKPDELSLNFKKANWKNLTNRIDQLAVETLEKFPVINSVAEIDICIKALTQACQNAMNVSIPKQKRIKIVHKFSNEIKTLIRARNHHRNAFKSTLIQWHKSTMNQLNRLIRKKITVLNQENFENQLAALSVKDNSLFSKTKSFKRKKDPIPPLVTLNGAIAYSDQSKAEAFADAFYASHTLTLNSSSPHKQKVAETLSKLNNITVAPKGTYISSNYVEAEYATVTQVLNIIESLNPKKASGPDSIPNRVLIALKKSQSTISLLTLIFNACIQFSYFPMPWKLSKVCAIPKKSTSSSNPLDYRPISLISCIGKLFEALILNKLKNHEESQQILIKQQFGFRNHHSTDQQILRIVEKAAFGFNNNKSTGVVMLDLEKAFDTVWHDGLIHKLSAAGYPVYLVKLIQSFLSNRKAFVSYQSGNSPSYQVPAGVPQGSLISPHLFNIFINDIPLPCNSELAIYADDTAIMCQIPWKNLSKAKKILLKALSSVHQFFSDWKIRLNSSKTDFTILTKSTKMIQRSDSDKIKFNNCEFSWSRVARYLGVILDAKLTFKFHINEALKKAKSLAFNSLYCLLKKGNRVPVREKVIIYKSIIRPILTYACPVFHNCAKTHLKKLQVFQNKILRMALNINWDSFMSNKQIHERARIPTLDEFMCKLTSNFYKRCDDHENPLISKLGQYEKQSLEFHMKHRLPKRL